MTEPKADVLQGTLDPMVQKGWISAKWGVSDNNRRAKFYSLTRSRRKQVVREAEDWQQIVVTLAHLVPARRALCIDPVTALRQD